jgi:hypothetical protein
LFTRDPERLPSSECEGLAKLGGRYLLCSLVVWQHEALKLRRVVCVVGDCECCSACAPIAWAHGIFRPSRILATPELKTKVGYRTELAANSFSREQAPTRGMPRFQFCRIEQFSWHVQAQNVLAIAASGWSLSRSVSKSPAASRESPCCRIQLDRGTTRARIKCCEPSGRRLSGRPRK